jgi:hypothetical protein
MMTTKKITAKWLTKKEMKQIRGGVGPSTNLCGDNRQEYACTVFSNGKSWPGTCGQINGRCKCNTEIGDYQTPNDHYGCEDALPKTTLEH